MPARHIAPRHKARRSIKRSLTRTAASATRAVGRPGATAALAVLGAATVVTGYGVHAAHPEASEQVSTTAAPDPDAVSAALKDHASSEQVSRSSARPPAVAVQRAAKSRALPIAKQTQSGAITETVGPADPRAIAQSMLPAYGWGSGEYACLDQLWISESDWDPYAENPTSGAYGIPQSLPPGKMSRAGDDWRTNPATQIEWGLEYIRLSYGTPCSAWEFKQANNWY